MQAEDGIRDLVRSRGLGDVYKRQTHELRQQAAVDVEQFTHTGRGRQVIAIGQEKQDGAL